MHHSSTGFDVSLMSKSKLDYSSLKCCNLIGQLEVSKSRSKPTFN